MQEERRGEQNRKLKNDIIHYLHETIMNYIIAPHIHPFLSIEE